MRLRHVCWEVFAHELVLMPLPATIRHQVLQVALIYMCGVAQLSPGAYFLRRDLFPAIVTVRSPQLDGQDTMSNQIAPTTVHQISTYRTVHL